MVLCRVLLSRGICACVAIGPEVGVHRVLALTFQSVIVHFFVALAPKNGPRGLASTASRSDWRPLVSKSSRPSGPANLFYSINNSILPQRDCRTRALSLQFPLQLVLRGPASAPPGFQRPAADQEQCEAAKRITTRAKILSIDGPKTKRQKRSGFQGCQSGPPKFKNM